MKTIILGLDALDPILFEEFSSQGKLPALTRLISQGSYARFGVSSPPQSEVSWTSIATGLNPADHGLFDFVHRNPKNYSLHVSLLPTRKTRFGIEFVRPHNAHTIFDEAAEKGYPAISLWWPATFPARLDSAVKTIPGLGTPDIHGRLGVGAAFSLEFDPNEEEGKIPVLNLNNLGKNTFKGEIPGPSREKSGHIQASLLPFKVQFLTEKHSRLSVGKDVIDLKVGEWSPIIELRFKMGVLVSVSAITQVIISRGLPSPKLYFLPLQIHPLRPHWRYATPRSFTKHAWQSSGGYLSLGWPQDTTALEEKMITDEQFLNLCEQIFETRKQIFLQNLRRYKEGILAGVFDTLDRVQHMFLRDRPDIIQDWYQRLDHLVGEVVEHVGLDDQSPHLLIVSDHGFSRFHYKVNTNRWLEETGYLKTKENNKTQRSLSDVDWSSSQAYAIGLNSLYLNLTGREGKGSVSLSEKEQILNEIRDTLLRWKGPDNRVVLKSVKTTSESYQGKISPFAPDLILGFSAGYRASADTGLGKWEELAIEENFDHWGADHCIDAGLVPGVLFSNRHFRDIQPLSYRDFPQLAIDMTPKDKFDGPQPLLDGQEQEDIEERLKGLGYL
jgi:predicted AlkP superfamily phosphohydrolase/phosphomutase